MLQCKLSVCYSILCLYGQLCASCLLHYELAVGYSVSYLYATVSTVYVQWYVSAPVLLVSSVLAAKPLTLRRVFFEKGEASGRRGDADLSLRVSALVALSSAP